MRFNSVEELPYETIGFRSQELVETMVTILSIGKERTSSKAYDWNGLTRKEKKNFVFQYTIYGEGAIRIDSTTHRLQQEDAFLIEVPSDHRYYLPERSERWEFIFISLQGEAAAECFNTIIQRYGHILKFSNDSGVIQKLSEIYLRAIDEDLIDHYFSSAEAYAFLMELYRHVKNRGNVDQLSDRIIRLTQYINSHFSTPLSMDELAEEAELSKYHLMRAFKEEMGMTVGQYLVKKRIEKALDLLVRTELPMREIAARTGFSNDNYFNKAFRKAVGMPPGEFRKHKDRLPFERLVIR